MCCIFSHPDLAYLKVHQGGYRYTPLPSIWKRAFNRARRPLRAAVEDLRPGAEYVQTILATVKDFRFCEKMFNDWMAEFDRCFSQPLVLQLSNDNNVVGLQ